ncbi:MAG: hypothetical protein AAB388_04570, partial [Patescibacteria group bacterium]
GTAALRSAAGNPRRQSQLGRATARAILSNRLAAAGRAAVLGGRELRAGQPAAYGGIGGALCAKRLAGARLCLKKRGS